MIGIVMKHEWRLLTRERIVLIAIPIYALLIGYGVYNGSTWKAFLEVNARAAEAIVEENITKLHGLFDRLDTGVQLGVFEDPRFAGRLARTTGFRFATKPPAATGALAVGQSDVYPSYRKVQWRAMFKQANTDESENPTNLRAGRFDLSFVLIYLYPLLIIALSFNILSIEREDGTQALLLSQPVPVWKFVTAKILLRGVVIIGTAVALSLLGLMASGLDIIGGESWRIVTWVLVVVAYGVFWFGLAVVVNAFRTSSSTNALTLVACWLLVVLLVPAAVSLVAKAAYPQPSRIELVQAVRRGDDIALKESSAQSEAKATDIASRGGEDIAVGMLQDFYRRAIRIEARGEAVSAPIFRRFAAQTSKQQALAAQLKYLSPALIAQMSLSELAENSSAAYADFSAQIEVYHQRYRDYFYRRVMESIPVSRADIAGIPGFDYVPRPAAKVLGAVLSDLIWLMIFSVAVVLAGFALLRSYSAAAG